MGRRLNRSVPLLTVFVVGTFVVPLPGRAQPDQKLPAFEVATVKKNKSGDLEQHIRRQPGGGLTVTNIPLRQLIVFAYLPLQPFQLVGGPSWIGNDRFDIVAKIEGNPPPTLPCVTPDALMLAMRTLLGDRLGGFPLSLLTTALSAITERMVFDRTGLTGNWDLTLTFQAE